MRGTCKGKGDKHHWQGSEPAGEGLLGPTAESKEGSNSAVTLVAQTANSAE